MTNNQNTNNLDETTNNRTTAEDEGFEVSDQAQNLGGGGKDERTIDAGETSDGREFSKTDQSVTQAAPGQTMTNTNQGGSNA